MPKKPKQTDLRGQVTSICEQGAHASRHAPSFYKEIADITADVAGYEAVHAVAKRYFGAGSRSLEGFPEIIQSLPDEVRFVDSDYERNTA